MLSDQEVLAALAAGRRVRLMGGNTGDPLPFAFVERENILLRPDRARLETLAALVDEGRLERIDCPEVTEWRLPEGRSGV